MGMMGLLEHYIFIVQFDGIILGIILSYFSAIIERKVSGASEANMI